jgi:hypothetical protein
MAIESANYVSQLDPSYPASTDNLADADNHLRLIKQTLKNTFPNLGAAFTGTASDLKGTIPVGGIIAWNGALNAIPSGWVLCAGQTGLTRSDGLGTINAPDLRDRFILGAGTTAVGVTGGAVAQTGSTNTAGAHAHGGTANTAGAHSHGGATAGTALSIAQMPSHNHVINGKVVGVASGGTFACFQNNASIGTAFGYSTEVQGSGSAHSHGISVDGNHTHSITSDTQGAHSHTVTVGDGRPPFYALAYIMRI